MDYFFRYYLCLLPSDPARLALDAVRVEQGWMRKIVEADRLHMTLVVLAETDQPWRDCIARLSSALDALALPACTVRVDRAKGGMLIAQDRLSGVHRLRDDIVGALLRHAIPCLHQPETPHVTLSYGAGRMRDAVQPVEWRADRLTLIESHYGRHRHSLLKQWPLSERSGFPPPPRQLNLWPGGLGHGPRRPYGPPTKAPRSTSSSTSPSSVPSQ